MTNNQLYLFLIYVISGIAIGIIFDLFRVLRKSIKTSNLITYIEDTIFWIIVGSFLIWEIFTVSYGELRSYIFIGLILGIILYLVTISKYFIRFNVKILNLIKRIIKKIILIFSQILSSILNQEKQKKINKINVKRRILTFFVEKYYRVNLFLLILYFRS